MNEKVLPRTRRTFLPVVFAKTRPPGWIARIVYFFHPVAHGMAYRLRLERELACDQIALMHTGRDARAYAETLVQVVSRQSEPVALRTAVGAARIDGGSLTGAAADSTHSGGEP